MLQRPNQGAAANGLSAMRSSVAGVRERAVRSTRAAEAVAELGSLDVASHAPDSTEGRSLIIP